MVMTGQHFLRMMERNWFKGNLHSVSQFHARMLMSKSRIYGGMADNGVWVELANTLSDMVTNRKKISL
jgi:hypothetical protein